MRIGIYGGSFDPVHVGHVNAALTFKEELSLDKIIVIPAYQPPHKKGLAMTPSEHRMNMCNLAFGKLEGFEISDIEINARTKVIWRILFPSFGKFTPMTNFSCLWAAICFFISSAGMHGTK